MALDDDGELEVNKKAQLSSKMLTCIQASITDEFSLKMVNSGECYEVEVEDTDYKVLILDGPLCLRISTSRVTRNTRSTVFNKTLFSYSW